jgi:DNA-binding MarR family transcriptional regulator
MTVVKKPLVRTELDDALVLAIGRMRGVWHQRMRAMELSPPQGITLKMLADGPLPMGSVAEALVCDASNMTGMADRLAERGLAVRTADPNDRRVKLLVITPEGQRMIEVMDAPLSGEFEGVSTLTEEERHTLAVLLRRAFS